MPNDNTAKNNILIVEDEHIVALDIKKTLERMGYNVASPLDRGEKIIDDLTRDSKNLPDLVLMDIKLRGKMNGIETARILSSDYDIPVIFLTAYADEQTINDAISTSPYGYLVKPYEERELKTSIEIALVKHRMEKKLKESQKRFREIFIQDSDAVILMKKEDFQVIDMNPAACALFQYNPDELMRNFEQVFHDCSIFQLFKKEVSDFSPTPKQCFFDRCRLQKRDKKPIICSIQVTIIKIHEEDVFYCVFRDITEQVKYEEESRQLQAKLIHANRMTAVGTLASGLAHEINNPNNFIMTNTQVIRQVWEDAAVILDDYYRQEGDLNLGGLTFQEAKELVPKLLQATVEGSRRIKFITDNLKEFSRPQDSQVFGKADINRIIEFSISMLSNQVKKYTDRFTFTPAPNIPLIHANFQQLEQVMVNLVQNALQALPDRQSAVHVSSAYDPDTDHIIVKVCDEGVGINKTILERIIEPFFTTKQDVGGMGLGLYISYSIVKAHHGSLEFESQPGSGTVAIVKIPGTFPGEK